MNERKFTPPTETEFPAEYRSGNGHKCVILAQDPSGGFVGYIVSGGKWRAREWDATGRFGISSTDPDLHDIPKLTSTWQNVYVSGKGTSLYGSRQDADAMQKLALSRIAVIRRDTINGVTIAHLEDV